MANRAEIIPGSPERRALVAALRFVVDAYGRKNAVGRITLARNPETGNIGVAYREADDLVSGFWVGPVQNALAPLFVLPA